MFLINKDSFDIFLFPICRYNNISSYYITTHPLKSTESPKILKENEKLPQNIIEQYQKYHNENLMGEWDKPLKSILKNFKRKTKNSPEPKFKALVGILGRVQI